VRPRHRRGWRRRRLQPRQFDPGGAAGRARFHRAGGDPTSTLLQDCASAPDKFFLLTSAQQIISTFDNISFKITQLHLAH
jgi:hypothetical protein